MPELRTDPLSGLQTIVAGERADRPGAGFDVEPRPPIDPEQDPFLPGHEDRTPPELYALRPDGGAPGGAGWTVRVVPNKFPALAAEGVDEGGQPATGAPEPLTPGRGAPALFSARPAIGAHEVIVNGPEPVSSIGGLAPEQLERAMGVWRERVRAHAEAAYVHVIVNEGREAGASLAHTHAQLFALDWTPQAVARERERFTAYHEATQGRNLLEDVLQEEVRRGERVVAIDGEAVALCPFAARVPFQLQLVPRRPRARFEDDGPLAAALLHDVLGRLERVLGGLPAFNLWVRTAPRGALSFCWRIDLLPRLGQVAGLELGTGVNLNALAPEAAAARLRAAA
jgi:UDPglucose--hexose-1-phosphate uridylyltransferase